MADTPRAGGSRTSAFENLSPSGESRRAEAANVADLPAALPTKTEVCSPSQMLESRSHLNPEEGGGDSEMESEAMDRPSSPSRSPWTYRPAATRSLSSPYDLLPSMSNQSGKFPGEPPSFAASSVTSLATFWTDREPIPASPSL